MKRFFWFALMATVLVASLIVTTPVASEGDIDTVVTNLSPYEGIAADINEAGQVVGLYQSTEEGGVDSAFIWTPPNVLENIGPGWGLNINDVEQVVGVTDVSDVDGYKLHAFIWTKDDGKQDIHTHEAPITWPFDINNQGQVVGWYSYGCPPWNFCLIPHCDGAFYWTEKKGMVDLTVETGEPLTCAYDINENGQIVGDSHKGPFVLSESGNIQYITSNPYDHAYSINDAGQVVGMMSTTGEYFIWSSGNMIPLDIYGTEFAFINDLGQVTGSRSGEMGSEAFIWTTDTGLLSLPHLGDVEYPYSYGARANNNGQIVGQSNNHAVLWTVELPPPATPQKQITVIDAKVDALVATGVLDQGEGTALISKLDAATIQVNKGNNNAARNILGAFINTIEAFVNSERLTSTQAQPLINATNTAINNLP